MTIDDDSEELYDGPDIIEEQPLDPVAARCNAFTKLLALVPHINDEEARKEAIRMLGAVRRSFRTIPTADDVTVIPGGKP